jgi:hypothetical protein
LNGSGGSMIKTSIGRTYAQLSQLFAPSTRTLTNVMRQLAKPNVNQNRKVSVKNK